MTARRRDEMAQLVRDFDTMAERLEASVNAQARLLNDISHELRSPLARLNVASALAHQRAGVEAHSALERIDLEADRLNDLIGGLLTIARLESGNDSRQKSPVFLGEMIEEIVADADFEGQGRNCGVKSVIKDDCMVMGAPSLLHSAIENVVRNATRYTQEGTNAEVYAGATARARGERKQSSASSTPVPECRKRRSTSSSGRSIASTMPAAVRPAAPDWVWPSPTARCGFTAGR